MMTLMKAINFTACLFLLIGHASAAEVLSDTQKLEQARALALRVYQETNDAQGAINVYEEAGIGKLLKGKPAAMSKTAYLNILHEYSRILARLPTRNTEAASLLKTVIQQDPSRHTAYLSLGDLYYNLYKRNPQAKYRSIYISAYKKYVKWLRQKKITVALSDRVITAVYQPQGKKICEFANSLLQAKLNFDLNHFFNGEINTQQLQKSEGGNLLGAGEQGQTFADFVANSVGVIRKSSVDIDNDRVMEVRYLAKTQANDCQRNLFYKNINNRTVLLSNPLLNQYYQAGRICGNSQLSVFRYQQLNYLFEQQIDSNEKLKIRVLSLNSAGQHAELCTLLPPTRLQENLKKECSGAICDKIASSIDAIVASDGQAGLEWLVSDISELQFDDAIPSDPELALFVNSQHQYLADIDNDGERELIARLWINAANVEEPQYRYRLFKKVADVWQSLPIPTVLDEAAPHIDETTWFFVEQANDKNYLVTYQALNAFTEENKSAQAYQIKIFLWGAGQVDYIGAITTVD